MPFSKSLSGSESRRGFAEKQLQIRVCRMVHYELSGCAEGDRDRPRARDPRGDVRVRPQDMELTSLLKNAG